VTLQSSSKKNMFQLLNTTWPLSCEASEPSNVEMCYEDLGNITSEFNSEMVCDKDIYMTNVIEPFNISKIILTSSEGVFMCTAFTNEVDYNISSNMGCILSDVRQCDIVEGNHIVTVLIYFAIRVVFEIAINSSFALLDGMALKQAKTYDCHYSRISIFMEIGLTMGCLVSGFLVLENETEEAVYQVSVFSADIFYLISAFLIAGLNINMDDVKKDTTMLKSFQSVLNPPIVILLSMALFKGFNYGFKQAFLIIYLQEELGASPELIG
jgi:hypothetical protein